MLHEFYRNEELRNEVQKYITDFLADEAVKKTFAREDVSHLADAKEIIDGAFDNLEVMFSKKAYKKAVDEAV